MTSARQRAEIGILFQPFFKLLLVSLISAFLSFLIEPDVFYHQEVMQGAVVTGNKAMPCPGEDEIENFCDNVPASFTGQHTGKIRLFVFAELLRTAVAVRMCNEHRIVRNADISNDRVTHGQQVLSRKRG